MASFHEVMVSFVWYTVEFAANIAVIVYVAHKMGFIGAPKLAKQDVPATLHETIKGTAGFMGTLAETVKAARGLVSSATAETTASAPVLPTVASVAPTPVGRGIRK